MLYQASTGAEEDTAAKMRSGYFYSGPRGEHPRITAAKGYPLVVVYQIVDFAEVRLELCDITKGLSAGEPFQIVCGEIRDRLAFAIVAMLKGQNETTYLFGQLYHDCTMHCSCLDNVRRELRSFAAHT